MPAINKSSAQLRIKTAKHTFNLPQNLSIPSSPTASTSCIISLAVYAVPISSPTAEELAFCAQASACHCCVAHISPKAVSEAFHVAAPKATAVRYAVRSASVAKQENGRVVPVPLNTSTWLAGHELCPGERMKRIPIIPSDNIKLLSYHPTNQTRQ